MKRRGRRIVCHNEYPSQTRLRGRSLTEVIVEDWSLTSVVRVPSKLILPWTMDCRKRLGLSEYNGQNIALWVQRDTAASTKAVSAKRRQRVVNQRGIQSFYWARKYRNARLDKSIANCRRLLSFWCGDSIKSIFKCFLNLTSIALLRGRAFELLTNPYNRVLDIKATGLSVDSPAQKANRCAW